MNLEIEMKYQLSDDKYNSLLSLFKSKAKYLRDIYQKDIYYSPVSESFYNNGDKCLRLRQENDNYVLCFKHIHNINTNDEYIEEYETKIDDYTMLDNILKALNFDAEIIVEKHRIELIYNGWLLIAFDRVNGLGCFLELENIDRLSSLQTRNQDLKIFAEEYKLDAELRNNEGYSNMLFRLHKESKI